MPTVATSYSNPGGTGDRTTLINMHGTAAMRKYAGYPYPGYSMLDGRNGNYADFQTVGNLIFDFGEGRVIQEIRWKQSDASTHGLWQVSGSNDGVTYTNIGSTFTLGGSTTYLVTALAYNDTPYRFYKMDPLGAISRIPYLQQVEFKIDDGTSHPVTWVHPQGWGDRSTTVAVTSTPAFAGSSPLPQSPVDGSIFSAAAAGFTPPIVAGSYYWTSATGAIIRFDFGAARVMQGVNLAMDHIASQGFWRVEGSNDNVTYTTVSAADFEWGPTAIPGPSGSASNSSYRQRVYFPSNVTGYRYYRLRHISGTISGVPYNQEIMFALGSSGGGLPPTNVVLGSPGSLKIDGLVPSVLIDAMVYPTVGALKITGQTPELRIDVIVDAVPDELTITGGFPTSNVGVVVVSTAADQLVIQGNEPGIYGRLASFVTQETVLTLAKVRPPVHMTQQAALALAKVIPDVRIGQEANLTLARVVPETAVSQVAQLTLVKRIIQPAILPEPEDSVNEVWEWKTDILTAQDGTEQRIALRDYPRRSFSGQIIYDDDELLNRQLQLMMDRFGDTFVVPLYQYRVRTSILPVAGDHEVYFDTSKLDIKVGDGLYIYSSYDGFQLVKILNIYPDRARISLPIMKDYGTLVWVMPCAVCVAPNNVSFQRGNVDFFGTLDLQASEVVLHKPFIREANTQQLEWFDDLPVLNARPIGTDFDTSFEMGLQQSDNQTGPVELRNTWKHGQNIFERTFILHRARRPGDFDRWKVFADYCKGSQKPFLMPSFRHDFAITVPAAPGSDRVEVEGIRYGPTYFGRNAFRRIQIETLAGVHRATVWSAARNGDNNVLYFLPPLPTGPGWDQRQKVSFLMQVRIADDKISFEHKGLHSTINMTMRTVDDDKDVSGAE